MINFHRRKNKGVGLAFCFLESQKTNATLNNHYYPLSELPALKILNSWQSSQALQLLLYLNFDFLPGLQLLGAANCHFIARI